MVIRQKMARTEKLVAQAEAQMAVHSEKHDDKKKGWTCRNHMARSMFKKERDQHAQELVELKARLDAALAGITLGNESVQNLHAPGPLDFVI